MSSLYTKPVSFTLFLVNFTVGEEKCRWLRRNKFKVGNTIAESISSKGELYSCC